MKGILLAICTSPLIIRKIILVIVLLLLNADISYAVPEASELFGDGDGGGGVGDIIFIIAMLPLVVVAYPIFFLVCIIINKRTAGSVKMALLISGSAQMALAIWGMFIGITFMTGMFATPFFMLILSYIQPQFLVPVIKTLGFGGFLLLLFYLWSLFILIISIRWMYQEAKGTKQQNADKSGAIQNC